MAELTTLTQLLGLRSLPTAAQPDRVLFRITPDWLQGRTTFGGLTAMLGAQAMRDVLGADWAPEVALRALQTSFVGPVGEGEVEAEVQLLRAGKNLRQVQATLRQHGQVVASQLAVYGVARDSALAPVWPQRPAPTKVPEQHPERRLPPGSPQFLRHFDMRWDHGPEPMSGGSGLDSRIHLRLREVEGLPLELLMVLLSDVPPTPVVGHFSKPTPTSSVTWSLELRPLASQAPGFVPASGPVGDGWWRIDCGTVAVDHGYINHSAQLWAPDGQLATSTAQLVMVFG